MTRDAERYQFMRKNFHRLIVSVKADGDNRQISLIEVSKTLPMATPESLDQAIDKAIERGEG